MTAGSNRGHHPRLGHRLPRRFTYARHYKGTRATHVPPAQHAMQSEAISARALSHCHRGIPCLACPLKVVYLEQCLQTIVLSLMHATLPQRAARLHLVRRLGQRGRARHCRRAGRAAHAARADRLRPEHRRLRLVRHRGRLLPGGGRREAPCQQHGQLRRRHGRAPEQPLLAGALFHPVCHAHELCGAHGCCNIEADVLTCSSACWHAGMLACVHVGAWFKGLRGPRVISCLPRKWKPWWRACWMRACCHWPATPCTC